MAKPMATWPTDVAPGDRVTPAGLMDPKPCPEPARPDDHGPESVDGRAAAQDPHAAPESVALHATAPPVNSEAPPEDAVAPSEDSSPASARLYSQAPALTSSAALGSEPAASSPPSSSSAVSVYKTVPITVPPSVAEPPPSAPVAVAAAEPPSDDGFPVEEAPRIRRSGPLRTAAYIVGIIAAGATIGFALKSQRQPESDANPGSDVSAAPERLPNPPASHTEAPAEIPSAKPAESASAAPTAAPSVAEPVDAPDATVGDRAAPAAAAATPRRTPAVTTRRSPPAMGGFVGRKVATPRSNAKKPVPTPRKANPGRELPDKLLF
jgi:hypothetical protein